jgi:hypothetical protein
MKFSVRIGLIRLADWSVYTTFVELLHVPYLAAQVINLAIFPVVKFLSVRSLFHAERVPLSMHPEVRHRVEHGPKACAD